MSETTQRLIYSIRAEDGRRVKFAFPLHQNTVSGEQIGDIMDCVLDTLDREVRAIGAANGDVLQALAMALACRAAVMGGSLTLNTALADDLAQDALAAVRASLATDDLSRSGSGQEL